MYDIPTEFDTEPSNSGKDVGIPLTSEGEELEKMASDPLVGNGVGSGHEKREESTEGLGKTNENVDESSDCGHQSGKSFI